MKFRFSRLSLATLVLCLLTAGVAFGANVSETLMLLQADGESYISQRVIRSDAPRHRFHLDKHLTLEQLGYIDPNQFEWDTSGEHSNVLAFEQGSFTVMYPGTLGEKELILDEQGVYHYHSWDGLVREDGHFGMWHEPGNYARFNYAWIFPENFEPVGYESNRDGEWVRRGNTLTFFAEDVNNLTFEIRYRRKSVKHPDRDRDGVPDAEDLCGRTSVGAAVDAFGCALDEDGDGVENPEDQCPATPPGTQVGEVGCEPDVDGDGVKDSADQCPSTPTDTPVELVGCPLDSDHDGVIDGADGAQAPGLGVTQRDR